MEVRVYDSTKRAEWDTFVFSNPFAGTGHLSAQFVLAESSRSGINQSLMLYENIDLIGILPLFERNSRVLSILHKHTLASPGAAGPLFKHSLPCSKSEEGTAVLVREMRRIAKEVNANSVSITYPSVIGERLAIERFRILPLRKYGFSETSMVGWYLDLKMSEAELFSCLDRKCRNMVRRAEKEGVTSNLISDRTDWLGCYNLVEETLGKGSVSREELEVIWDEFISRGFGYAVALKYQSHAISIVVATIFRGVCYYWYGFNAKDFPFPGCSNAALWRAIMHGKLLGSKFFLLGTCHLEADEKNLRISAFKQSFGGTPYYVLGGLLRINRKKSLALEFIAEVIRDFRPDSNVESRA